MKPNKAINDAAHGTTNTLRALGAMGAAVQDERERCARMVPTNWCDALLTGPDAPKLPMDGPALEKLLLAIQKRILEPKS